jgi:CDP-paratose 2-epimerase
LAYHGFGGSGKQVRDVLHVDDLFDLVALQLASLERWDGTTYNVGGGRDRTVSLAELTALCRSVTGREIPIGSVSESHAVDVPIFVTDTQKVQRAFGWQPRRTVERVVQDLHAWIEAHREALRPIFG